MRLSTLGGLAALALTAGCISEEDYKAIVAERDAAFAEVKQLKDDLDVAKGRIKELEKLAERAEDIPTRPPPPKVNAARTQLKLGMDSIIRAKLDTSMGEILCDLYPNIAPETVLNFVGLAEGTKEWVEPKSGEKTVQKLYDGTLFHRVTDGFMIQGGDPVGTGKGGPGYRFGDEIWPDVRFDDPGLLAMANTGPDTNGSQFFITSVPAPHLNGKHTIFGRCGLETVQEIMKVETDEAGRPKKDVVLKTVTILRENGSASKPVIKEGPAPSVAMPAVESPEPPPAPITGE